MKTKKVFMLKYLAIALMIFLYMSGWFVVSIIRKRNDVADEAWGVGFVLTAWSAWLLSGPILSWRALLVNLLVTIWGLRLAWHISRRHRHHPEDARYQVLRTEWKHFLLQSYVQIFMLQGACMFLIALPVIFINLSHSTTWSFTDVLGVAIWLTGFFFESVGDWQLKQFLAQPQNKGKIMDQGLWRYTRHPNYFGEVTQWWGIFCIALSLPYGFLTVVGPLTITFLITCVSGVPMLEKKYAGRPDFEAYKKRTSIFFPLPPKK